MPRRRKADADAEIVTDAQTEPQEPIKKKIKTVSEWVETVAPNGSTDADDADDPLEAIFDELDAENRYMLTVERLPDFMRDGKIATRATRIYCGRIPFTRDYLDQIQQIWGAGNYRLTARYVESGQIRKIWFESVERPPQPPQTPYQPQPYPVPVFAHEEKRMSDIEQLSVVAQQLAAIRDAMGWTAPQQTTPPESSTEDKKLDLLINILAKNESLGEKLLERLFGEEREESVWSGLVRAIPDIIALIARQQPNALPQSRPQQTEDESEDGEEPHMILISQLLQQMAHDAAQSIVNQASIERGAAWIRQFQREHPEHAELILSLINGTPEQVMSSLVLIYPEAEPLRKNPFCLEWIKRLQERLRRP